MTFIQITSLLVVLAALFAAVNALFLRLPSPIGILIVALLASFAILGVDTVLPELGIADEVRGFVDGIDFTDTVLEGMLGLLLFAGALHVKLGDLRAQWLPVLLMATVGVLLSAIVVGVGFSWITGMPILVALVLGAIVSPTDPVAVLGVLREARLPPALETQIAGESLFNDGMAYVLFLALVGLAFGTGGEPTGSVAAAIALFLREAGGGALLGLVLGWLTFRIMRRIDDYAVAVLLTLGLAFGGYELALLLDVSAPLMAVTAGLLIGHVGPKGGMSEATRNHVDVFWKLIDEILNAILFLLIGFEVFEIAFSGDTLKAGAAAIALSLVARFVAVALPLAFVGRIRTVPRGVVPIMTWGGLKGGVSVALALSLPEGEWTPLVLAATYMIVVFSIVVQGLTVGPLARRAGREPELL